MKKRVLMALALIIGTTTLFANNVTPDDSPDKMRSQIIALMDAPDFKINVLNVDSKNKA